MRGPPRRRQKRPVCRLNRVDLRARRVAARAAEGGRSRTIAASTRGGHSRTIEMVQSVALRSRWGGWLRTISSLSKGGRSRTMPSPRLGGRLRTMVGRLEGWSFPHDGSTRLPRRIGGRRGAPCSKIHALDASPGDAGGVGWGGGHLRTMPSPCWVAVCARCPYCGGGWPFAHDGQRSRRGCPLKGGWPFPHDGCYGQSGR
jgi:hypothetical protein